MEIILQQDYPAVGFTGQRVLVKNGYARNFLIPKGIAIEVNKRNEKFLKNQLQAIEAKKAKLKSDAEALSEKVFAEKFEFKLKVGDKGKAFGSLHAKDIHAAVVAKGYDVSRHQVVLSEPIKFVGDFKFTLKLHSEVSAEVPITVIAEQVKKATSKKKKGKKAKDQESEEETTEDLEAVDQAVESEGEEVAAPEEVDSPSEEENPVEEVVENTEETEEEKE